jgi:hypothetical protein
MEVGAAGGTQVAARSRLEQAVLSQLSGGADAAEAASGVLRLLGERFGMSVAVLWRPEHGGTHLSAAAVWRSPDDQLAGVEAALRSRLLGVGEGLAGLAWVLRERQSRSLGAPASVDRAGLRVAAAYPLVRDGVCEGVIEFLGRFPGEPDAELGALLDATGGQIARRVALGAEERRPSGS